MEWNDTGIIIKVRSHGESSAVVTLLTREHGRHAGFVRGGQSKRMRPILQLGNEVSVQWKARISDQLGFYTLDMHRAHAANMLTRPDPLLALRSACVMADKTLPERHAYPGIHDGLVALIEAMEHSIWAEAYVIWELNLLKALGFGLHLDRCAVTGAEDNLAYVSPRTGRAVTAKGAGEFTDKLIPLPQFLCGAPPNGLADISNGLTLTGYFLEKFIFHPMDKTLPDIRLELQSLFSYDATYDKQEPQTA